jgi:OHCU decarboxylase
MRVFGQPVDSERDASKLVALNAMAPEQAESVFLAFNGSKRWARSMAAQRPFATVRALFDAAEQMWWSSGEGDFLEAFAAHPRIGEKKAAASQNAQSATWSAGEQSGAARAESEVLDRLASQNAAYFDKFGFIYICFATGRTAPEMLEWLDDRLERTRAEEIETAAGEQSKITRLRLEKWLDA